MFKGIVEKTGKLKKIDNRNGKIYFTVEVKDFFSKTKVGDSISCDGVCLTVVKIKGDTFEVELMPETLRLTRFSNVKVGCNINLEHSLRLGDTIDGHFVSGHVDCVGKIKTIQKDGDYTNLIIAVPEKISKYLALKGSSTVNGVSLTIAGETKNSFKVCLITHTLEITNLADLKVGDLVNIEVDLLARYLEKLMRK